MTDLMAIGQTMVRAEVGMWLADCPRPWCTNALAVERGQREFVCVGPHSCAAVGELTWPADPDAIEAILMLRPVPVTRNWLPGETLEQLLAENAQHGCIPDEWLQLAGRAPGGQLDILEAVDQRVVGGLLLQHLEAAGVRREIGA